MDKDILNQIATIQDLENLRVNIVNDIWDKLAGQNQKKFLSPKEYGALTGIPYSTVVNKCKTGKIKARQDDPNGNWLIQTSELQRYEKEADENI